MAKLSCVHNRGTILSHFGCVRNSKIKKKQRRYNNLNGNARWGYTERVGLFKTLQKGQL